MPVFATHSPNPCAPEKWREIRRQLAGENLSPHVRRRESRPGPHLRLRQRILESGPESLADEELLEYLLLAINPYSKLTRLSERLVQRFGGLAEVLDSTATQLSRIGGLGESTIAMLKIVPEMARRMALEELLDRPVLSAYDKVLAYCRIALGHKKTEQFHLLFLDTKNRLIADEKQQRGTVNHTPVYPREVVKRALELDAAALIMVHNHPSGDPTPSKSDIAITRAVQAAAASVDIAVLDHIVIGRSGHSSFKSLGLV